MDEGTTDNDGWMKLDVDEILDARTLNE